MSARSVFLVEADANACHSIACLLKAEGISVQTFHSSLEFLGSCHPEMCGCLVLNVELPSMTGLKVRSLAVDAGCDLPFLMIGVPNGISQVTEAMRQGAVDFLPDPIDAASLVTRVRECFDIDEKNRLKRTVLSETQSTIDALTKREREVFELVVGGKLSKQIGKLLGISTSTVEVHRFNITRKFGVSSMAEVLLIMAKYNMLNGFSEFNFAPHISFGAARKAGQIRSTR